MEHTKSDTSVNQLKTLISQALEKRGVLSKLKAELRAEVFQAIHTEENQQENDDKEHDSLDSTLIEKLVKDYLKSKNLTQTAAIYEIEKKSVKKNQDPKNNDTRESKLNVLIERHLEECQELIFQS